MTSHSRYRGIPACRGDVTQQATCRGDVTQQVLGSNSGVSVVSEAISGGSKDEGWELGALQRRSVPAVTDLVFYCLFVYVNE